MNYFWKKIKLFTAGAMIILFLTAISVSSCNPKKAESEDTEQEAEHPSGDAQEHPTDQEHPSDHEHPADTTGSEEHPTN